MLKRAAAFLGRLIDPVGPVGEIVSPSEVYKSRLGLPTQSPHVARVQMEAPAHVEHTLAPARFASMDEVAPPDRVRQVSAFVDERWTPVYERTDSADLVAIVLASQRQIGWTVTQHESQQSRLARKARQNAEEFVEVLQSAQIQASDEWANGYYETIAGNDPVVVDGEILRAQDGSIIRGGTMITGGRREYREKTKGYAHWDKGFLEKRRAAIAEMNSRPVRNVRRALESLQGELPMHRPVGLNLRRDRRSAV